MASQDVSIPSDMFTQKIDKAPFLEEKKKKDFCILVIYVDNWNLINLYRRLPRNKKSISTIPPTCLILNKLLILCGRFNFGECTTAEF